MDGEWRAERMGLNIVARHWLTFLVIVLPKEVNLGLSIVQQFILPFTSTLNIIIFYPRAKPSLKILNMISCSYDTWVEQFMENLRAAMAISDRVNSRRLAIIHHIIVRTSFVHTISLNWGKHFGRLPPGGSHRHNQNPFCVSLLLGNSLVPIRTIVIHIIIALWF